VKKLFIEQTADKVGQEVELYGWVNSKRDHKQIVFIDLRDRSGSIQIVGNESFKPLSPEDVIYVKGIVKERPKNLINEKMKTGKIEVEVNEFKLLGKAKTLPFPIDSDGSNIDEELRLKYRYLDLRRKRMLKNMLLRSSFIQEARDYFYRHGFIEIHTPVLSKTTPEGARDFLVPSRLQKGKFYALPQSPQQYKQLLMIAGIEKYFQIAPCFRDEDPRADRAYGEFYQIDIEMSFVEREDVMRMTEQMIIEVFEKLGAKIKQKPFPIFTYKEAMEKFGADKFDLRTEEDKKNNLQAFGWVIDFPFFEKTKEGGWTFTHNPFSAPLPAFKQQLLEKQNIESILTSQYDLVCNGFEVGGGSIRAHEPNVLETVFEIMGYKKEEVWEQFGHMLEALSYGAPPHGGIAPGIDRLLTCIAHEPSLREVIPFPLTSGGRTSIMEAPSEASQEQLAELGIAVKTKSRNKKVFDQIRELLDSHTIQYKILEHPPVYTSKDAAKIRGTELTQGAKALIMYGDKKPLMLVLPAHLSVDMKKFKMDRRMKDLRMATPQEVKKITGVEIGAIPPFGNLFEVEFYVDKKLGENKDISFNAGEHTKSIVMKYIDFERVTKPVILDFSTKI